MLTVSTRTGYDHAQSRCEPATLAWLPFDHAPLVQEFVRQVQPRLLALVETELWPRLVYECTRAGVPIALVNGRLSARHYKRYRLARAFFRPTFERLSLAAMQDEAYRERAIALGAHPAKTIATGSTKFDGARLSFSGEERAAVWHDLQLPPSTDIIVFGSTREGGDEALAQRCWERLRDDPNRHLVIAPRHNTRLEDALKPFSEPVLRFSDALKGQARNGERITVVDVTGHLVRCYAIARVAVIGGSFYGAVNGHNPIEPAALGIPTLFGPKMGNFRDAAEQLTAAHGAVQVASPDDLPQAILDVLTGGEGEALGSRGREVVVQARGAIARTLDAMATLTECAS